MDRSYPAIICEHLAANRQMFFLAGPRQVGKTTAAAHSAPGGAYFNWDNEDHRHLILSGPGAVMASVGLGSGKTLVFDELHKYPGWQDFLKGWFDTYASDGWRAIVTGSARLDILRRGADSLMGRYFLYRMHPLSVREIVVPGVVGDPPEAPVEISDQAFETLLLHGGFPEPYQKANRRFSLRWQRQRSSLIFREDLRDISRVYELGQVETLATLLKHQVGELCNYSSLAKKVRASADSIRRWVGLLGSLYFCFLLRPWSTNVPRSLLKEPKVFLWDWAFCADTGARNENFIACHLLKAVHCWQDAGLGEFDLHYLRNKDQREVDFVVSRDGRPWFLVEVKTSAGRVSPHLRYFQERIAATHAFQVVINMEYVAANCFDRVDPLQVPARTLLSQLP